MEMVRVGEPEDWPDVWKLFRHYDELYFRGALSGAGFAVQWSSRTTAGCFGSFAYGKQGNTITLSEPVLKNRPDTDLKKALLHHMIHAMFCVKHDKRDCGQHGPFFRAWMDAINSCSFEDNQRPSDGYNISSRHDFGPEESWSIQGFLWECESCGDNLVRATKLGPPSDTCCIENVGTGAICGNMLCNWHNHKINCGGTYAKAGIVSKAPKTKLQKETPKGRQRLLTESSEMSKSQRNVQESDSGKLPDNATVGRSNAEGKHFSLVGSKKAKSLGSSSLKKAGKTHRLEDNKKPCLSQDNAIRRSNAEGKSRLVNGKNVNSPRSSFSKKAGKRQRPEDIHISSVLPADHLRKQKMKQELLGLETRKLLSLVGCNEAVLGGSTPEKAGKRYKPDNDQKSSVLPISSQKILKLEQDLVAPQEHGFPSLKDYRNAKQRSSTSIKIGKQHKPEGVQKACALLAVPPRKPSQDSVVSNKNEFSCSVGCKIAEVLDSTSSKKVYEHEGMEKTLSLPAAPQSKLKQPNETSSLNKAGNKHKPQDIQRTAVLRTVKQELVASEKNKKLCSSALDSRSRKKACEQHEPENTQRTISSTQEKSRGVFSSIKIGKQHKPEVIQKTAALLACPLTRSKLKQQNLVASRKQKRGCKTSKPGREEFAVISAWLNYYESEGSSGSPEPLVNKRTERRKRAKYLSNQMNDLRSKKQDNKATSLAKIEPPEDGSSQQSQLEFLCLDTVIIDPVQPPANPCLDIVVIDPDEEVMIQASGDPDLCLDLVSGDQMVPLATNLLNLSPSNARIEPDIVVLSDDD